MNFILIALVPAIFGTLATLLRRKIRLNNFLTEHRKHLAEEKEQLQQQLSAIIKVIAQSCGGVEKRISEHQEIVKTIAARHPKLFNDDPGLVYLLNANEQFFKSLKAAAFGEEISAKQINENQDDLSSKEIVEAFFARIKNEMNH